MKRIVMTVTMLLALVGITYFTNQKEELKEDTKPKSTLAIMIEKANGDYEEAASIPSSGYTFNSTLSGCENGGSVTFDGTNVNMKSNTSDKCYLYFDLAN